MAIKLNPRVHAAPPRRNEAPARNAGKYGGDKEHLTQAEIDAQIERVMKRNERAFEALSRL